ncbi:MAG: hypothetical protein ACI4Q4_08235 [Oscillospiraceae bacterium]
MEVIQSRLAGFLGSDKARRLIIIVGVVLILLLFLSTVVPQKAESAAAVPAENTEEIEHDLEARLAEMIGHIAGAGTATVMVTLESSSERIFAEDTKTDSTDGGSSLSRGSETETVLAGSAKEPLERSTIMPKVRGVAVVCAGAANPAVKERIANAVACALGIGISRVYVTC